MCASALLKTKLCALRTARARRRGARAGALSDAADPAGRRLRRRRADRYSGALHRRQARRRARPARRRGEQAGRRRHDRDPRRALAAARRLHPAALHPFRGDQHRRLQERRSSSSATSRRSRSSPNTITASRWRTRFRPTRLRRLRAIRQGASRRGDLRHHRRRLGAGDPGAAAGKAHRHQHEPDSVPRRPAGGAGAGRRPRALLRLADAGDRPAIRGQAAQDPGGVGARSG